MSGLPTSRLLLRLQRRDSNPFELHIRAGDLVALHDTESALVPHAPEQAQADWLHLMAIHEAVQVEAVALRLLLQCCDVEGLAWGLLQHEDRVSMIWRALLGEWWQPGEDELGLLVGMREWKRGLGWGDWDIAGDVVAAGREPVLLWDGHIGVDHDHRHETLALVEHLDLQTRRDLGDAGIDDLSRLDVAAAEGETHVGSWDEVGEDIRDDVELGDTLFDQQLLVFAPFLLGEIAVDRFVHVAWKSPLALCKVRK